MLKTKQRTLLTLVAAGLASLFFFSPLAAQGAPPPSFSILNDTNETVQIQLRTKMLEYCRFEVEDYFSTTFSPTIELSPGETKPFPGTGPDWDGFQRKTEDHPNHEYARHTKRDIMWKTNDGLQSEVKITSDFKDQTCSLQMLKTETKKAKGDCETHHVKQTVTKISDPVPLCPSSPIEEHREERYVHSLCLSLITKIKTGLDPFTQ